MKTILFIISIFGLSINSFSQYSKLFQFSNLNYQGKLPCANLISIGNQLYGTISQGAGSTGNGNGGIFKINKDGTNFNLIKGFGNTTQGQNPMGTLYFDGTYLYGTTYSGGGGGYGAFFKMLPDGSNFISRSAFSPRGSFVSDGSSLYTTDYIGGTSSKGSICKVNPLDMTFQILYSFNGVNGEIPKGDLLRIGIYLYGMTEKGGINGFGTLFRIKTDGTGFQKLLDFAGTNGAGGPTGSYIGLGGLITDSTFLYGMTCTGGINNQGVIFKIQLDGTNYQKLLDLNNTITGSLPFGALYYVNNRLFGMTSSGGLNTFGTIFMIKKDGTNFQKIHDFDGIDGGRTPFGSFYYENGFLYGMTSRTGSTTTTNDEGLIFKKKVCVPTTSNNNATSCKQYIWHGQTYTQSGTFIYSLNNSQGCDSVAILNLTINNVNKNINVSGNTIISQAIGATYQWLNCDNKMSIINGATSQSFKPSLSGNYAVKITQNGCIDTSNCIFICIPTSSNNNVTTCNQYTWHGQTFKQSGTYTYTLVNAQGCDSIATLNLTIDSVNKNINVVGNTITSQAIGATYRWLNCNNNMSVINGETSQSYTPLLSGNYAVKVTQNNCIDTSNCISITTVGIDEVLVKMNFVAFPNPTTKTINISFESPQALISLRLITIDGKLLTEKTFYQTEKIEFNLMEPNGIYFLELTDNFNNKSRLRVVKQ